MAAAPYPILSARETRLVARERSDLTNVVISLQVQSRPTGGGLR
jgi:hypothetical protein